MKIKPRTVAGRRYVVAEIDEPVTTAIIDQILESGVTGVAMSGPAVARTSDLSWLEDLETCVSLEIDGPLRKNQLSAAVLRRLEVLELPRPSAVVLSTDDLPGIRVLTLGSSAMLTGGLASCFDLRGVTFSRHDRDDLRIVDDCGTLEWLKLRGVGQVVDTNWSSPPETLKILMIEKLYLRTLAGLRTLTRLQRFQSYTRALPQPIIDLDLSDLQRCEALEWLAVASLGRLHNIDRLAGLPKLQSVLVYEGWFTPDDVAGVPLNVASAP